MPVKGKKKAQARGSQGRRRPAAAPRPVIAPRKPPAWYRTGPGRAVLVIVVLALVGGVVAAVAATRNDSGAATAEALDRYTGEVRGALQLLRPAASDMSSAPGTLGDRDARKALGEQAAAWTKSLSEAHKELARLLAPGGAETAQSLFVQSAEIYLAAAKTYALAARIEGDASAGVLARAAEQRDHGGRLWQSATALLDAQRAEAELRASGLTPPSLPGAQPQPEPGSEQSGDSGASKDGGGG